MAKKAPAKKSEGYIAKAPIRRLNSEQILFRRVVKKEGADLVAAEALDKLINFLESSAASATKDAIKVCKEDKRKRVTAADIRAATR